MGFDVITYMGFNDAISNGQIIMWANLSGVQLRSTGSQIMTFSGDEHNHF
jgi:hypothetical protein